MKRFSNIVYVFEDGITQDNSIARAVTLAQNNQACLTVIDIVPDLKAGKVQERQKQLESLLAPYREHASIQIEIVVGKVFIEVIRAVLRNHYDLVIKLGENPGYIERLFGSDDMHLLRKCPCPVWLLKPQEKLNYQRIVAALDFDTIVDNENMHALNRQILELASSFALSDFAELHLVHVWDVPEANFVGLWANNPDMAEKNMVAGERLRRQSSMESVTRELREWIGAEAYDYLSPQIHLHKGSAKVEVPALSNTLQADLVVMGTVVRTGIPGFIIGNTAEAILDQLRCSVLAVKPPGFATPVTLD